MERALPHASNEAGFLLLEAIVAAALVAICAGAALAAVAAVTHAAARSIPASALTLTAQNVLTDLRVATAYDPAELAALAGRSVEFEAGELGVDGLPEPVHISAAVTHSAVRGYVAAVRVTAANGTAVMVEATLVQEAPAPGSVIPAANPPPDARTIDAESPAAASGALAL